jgi:hypothetical protein
MLNNAMSFFETGNSRPRAKVRQPERKPAGTKPSTQHKTSDSFDSFDEF